jgi:hypothetical protein
MKYTIHSVTDTETCLRHLGYGVVHRVAPQCSGQGLPLQRREPVRREDTRLPLPVGMRFREQVRHDLPLRYYGVLGVW